MKFDIKTPVAILGFGVEGQSALEFLQNHGVSDITICDNREGLDVPKGIKTKVGQGAMDDLTQFKTIIRSPGVQYNLLSIRQAQKLGTKITSMTQMTLDVAKTHLTAITGSNGKTTTTTLLHSVLEAYYGDKLIVGGNDRRPVLERFLVSPDSHVLMEGSSFQFSDVSLSPHIAAILNITPNHMDWHDDFDDYVAAKANLIRYQVEKDWCVLNANDKTVASLASMTKAKLFWIGQEKGENWAIWRGDDLFMRFNGLEEVVLSKKDIKIKTHPDNILFVVSLSKINGVDMSTIVQQIKEFKGVEHRLEYVHTVQGVQFYNDSSCTTPESAEVAIDQFDQEKLILMLGGSSKNADFTSLAKKIVDKKVRIYCYGQEGEHVQKAVQKEGGSGLVIKNSKLDNFRHIVEDVLMSAKPGDSIVLSPACASFDMFKNSKERGRIFKEIVKELS